MTGSLRTTRWNATLLGNGRGLLAGGGNPNGLAGASAELYDPASRGWSATGSMNAPRGGAVALLQDGRVLVAGGGTGDVYSPATGTWTATGPMVYPYAAAAAAALLPNGQVLYSGADVVAYDLRPPGTAPNTFHRGEWKRWGRVFRGSSAAAVRRHRDRSLFLCWPPHDDDAASYAPLRAYRGDVLIYVGESGEGVTGTLRFQRELELNWTPVEDVELPRWPWLDDRLVVYRRNAARRPLVERDRCEECKRFLPTGRFGRCDWCFERRPPALALKVGVDRIEYPSEYLDSVPPALRAALERSPNRIR